MSQLRVLTEFISLFLLLRLFCLQCEALPRSTVPMQFYNLSPFTFPSIQVYEVRREGVDSVNNDILVGKDDSSTLQRVNASRNSDLLFGEMTSRNNALLLHCNAPYSVQWIFRGDSDPEFNTNTTTEVDANGRNSYSAYLLLGSRRNLNERETGKYICTSVRNKRLNSFLYVFVTKSALFTNRGLETIYFNDNDDSVRIPCSLSEPRAVATLQKYQNGVLKCPMNDSVRFDAKEGFLLNPKKLQNPEGTYLCLADYNNTFQIIKYDVIRDNEGHGHHNSSQEQTSDEFETPPNHPGQQQPTQTPLPPTQQTTPTNPTQTPILYPPSEDDAACVNKTCGNNAFCRVNSNGDAVCRCDDNYIGNPYVECKHKSEFATTTSSPPPQHSESTTYRPPTRPTTSNPGSSHEHEYACDTSDECPNDRACLHNVCRDPCKVNSICGPNTNCATQYHTPFCSCKNGFEGDPYSNQQGQQCDKSHCDPNPCGQNTICKYVNGIISCSCQPGFTTHHDGACYPSQKKKAPKPEQLTQGHPLPRPLSRNRTHTLASGKECHYDTDCPDDKMCIQDKCEDPCVNACGSGAVCHTRNHFPRCLCPEGTTGDPFYKCSPLFSGVIGTSTTSISPPPQSIESQQGSTFNCGGDNSPCGPNTVCQANKNQFVCVCPNNFVGNPYSSKGCTRKLGYLKCEKDSDCPYFLACLRNQGCVNPCNVKNVCRNGLSCISFHHRPTCLQTDNFNTPYPRDGLTAEKALDEAGDIKEEIPEIPVEMNSNRCFVRKEGKAFSVCGKNSICYDDDTNALVNVALGKEGIFCGCLENYTGDPFVACEPTQPCTNSSVCGEKKTCVDGFCRDNFSNNSTSQLPENNDIKSINPCSPSPCTNSNEICTITRANNSAKCVPLSSSKVHLSVDLLRSSTEMEDDEFDDFGSTTDSSGDFTFLPSTATSSSYLSSQGVPTSLEYISNTSTQRHFVDISSSVETTPSLLNDEETVVDV